MYINSNHFIMKKIIGIFALALILTTNANAIEENDCSCTKASDEAYLSCVAIATELTRGQSVEAFRAAYVGCIELRAKYE